MEIGMKKVETRTDQRNRESYDYLQKVTDQRIRNPKRRAERELLKESDKSNRKFPKYIKSETLQ
jgi:hypothetical protein